MRDLRFVPATELASMIRHRDVSPVEVVDAFLAAIEQHNPALNLFCFVYPHEARAAARRAETAVLKDDPLGPLHGVPFAIKDFTPTRGKRTTLGSYAFEHWVPDDDPPILDRLYGAGGILIGKTTTPEFAHSGFTYSPLWGVSRNPWDPARTPGGSSGGSAGAVAAAMVPVAEGSDAGGSIRIPAAFCGVVGFKPSHGRIPMHITPNDFESIFHLGPIARTVTDAALMFSVMQGPDERDPTSLVPSLEVSLRPDTDLTGVRLALSLDLGYYAIDPEVASAVTTAAGVFRSRGAIVEAVELGWSREINDAWFAYWGVVMAASYGDLVAEHGHHMDPGVRALIESGSSMSAVDLKRIELLRSRQWQAIRPILEQYDALLCPTTALTAPPAEAHDRDFEGMTADGRYAGLDLTSPFNFIGQCPVVSVPCGFSRDAMPIGLQIVGRRFDDLSVLRLAAAFEEAAPWKQRRPPIQTRAS
jgi:Asp-tRNA(Asn)/Glu-tRNA(Gln) amidotransferase A subunit family amidase